MITEDQIEIDAGHTLISLVANKGKKGVFITAYVNGMSCRCGNLTLPRVVDLFISCIIEACDYPDDGLQNENIEATEEAIFSYIAEMAGTQEEN